MMKKLFAVGVVAVAVVYGLVLFAAPAWADIPFSGSGTSGTFSSAGAEPFTYNVDNSAGAGYSTFTTTFGSNPALNWGSPGVASGTTSYGEVLPAYGLELSFDTGTTIINPATLNQAGSCPTGSYTGTVFCDITAGDVAWPGTLIGSGTIEFLSPSGTLNPGDTYFTNVFFSSEASTSFSGSWLTVPEPGSLSLFTMGFLGLGLIRFRKLA
jgi:hypothetical protein